MQPHHHPDRRTLLIQFVALHPSDLTDEEWALVALLIPPAKRGGNKRTINVREVVNGLMYILSAGCRVSFADMPPADRFAMGRDAQGLGPA